MIWKRKKMGVTDGIERLHPEYKDWRISDYDIQGIS